MPNKKSSGRGKNIPQTHVAASVGTDDSRDQVKRLLMAAVRLIEAIAGRQKSALLDEFKAELRRFCDVARKIGVTISGDVQRVSLKDFVKR